MTWPKSTPSHELLATVASQRKRIEELETRMERTEGTLHAILKGDSDALIISTERGERTFTHEGADYPYRALVEEMNGGTVTLDADGLVLYSNREFASMMRLPIEKVAGCKFQRFLAPHSHEKFNALVAGRGQRSRGALTLVADDRAMVPVYFSVSSLPAGGVQSLCVVITNLTDQGQEEAIVREQQLSRLILEQSSEAIVVLDTAYRILRANAPAERLANRAVLLQDFTAVFPLEPGSATDHVLQPTGSTFPQLVAKAQAGESLRGIAISLHHPGADPVPLLLSLSALRSDSPGLAGYVVTLTDLGERTNAEQRSRHNEEHLQLALDSGHIGIWELNLVTQEARRTPNHDRILGYEEMLPEYNYGLFLKHVVEEDRARVDFQFWKSLEESKEWDIETRIRRADGEIRWIWTRGRLYQIPGEDPRLIGVISDIDDRKHLEETFRESAKLESIGVLAGGMAHDFNNLLTAILGNASLAIELLGQQSPAQGCLQNVIRASERAASLTQQLLAYSGRGKFIVTRIDVADLVVETAALIKRLIPRIVKLDVEPGEDPLFIVADSSQMQQLMTNLIVNGAEAIGDKPGHLLVRSYAIHLDEKQISSLKTVADLSPGRYVCIEVKDDGCGMDQATLRRMFDPFFTTKFTGRGLGLSAVFGIVRGHGAGVRVESTLGEGTTFQVFFPAFRGKAERASLKLRKRQSGRGKQT